MHRASLAAGLAGLCLAACSNSDLRGISSLVISENGSTIVVHGLVGQQDDRFRLADGGHLRMVRRVGGEEREVLVVRRGELHEAAARHGERIGALDDEDLAWVFRRLDVEAARIVPSPEIDSETDRQARVREALNGAVPLSRVREDLAGLLFPSAVVADLVGAAGREQLGPADQASLLECALSNAQLLPADRDRIAGALAGRGDLAPDVLHSLILRLERFSYDRRGALAVQLTGSPSFDAAQARSMLSSLDHVPYDGRAEVLERMLLAAPPGDEWLQAALEKGPYDQRLRLIRAAFTADPQEDFPRLVRERFAMIPYDARTEVFLDLLDREMAGSEVDSLVHLLLEQVPYDRRGDCARRMLAHPRLGRDFAVALVERSESLPYDFRGDFLERVARRADLDGTEQVWLVKATFATGPYDRRLRALKALLENPSCGPEARAMIRERRKELPPDQRDEIAEFLMGPAVAPVERR